MDHKTLTPYTPIHPYLKVWNRKTIEDSEEFKEFINFMLEYLFIKVHPLTAEMSKQPLYHQFQKKVAKITRYFEGVRDANRYEFRQANKYDEIVRHLQTNLYL